MTENKKQNSELLLAQALKKSGQFVVPPPELLHRILFATVEESAGAQVRQAFRLAPIFWDMRFRIGAFALVVLTFVFATGQFTLNSNRSVNDTVLAMEIDAADVEGDIQASKIYLDEASVLEMDSLDIPAHK